MIHPDRNTPQERKAKQDGKVPQDRKVPHFLVLIAITTIGTLALNIFIPSMPSLVSSLNTTASNAQLVLSVYLFSIAVGQLIVGPLSDKYGRRPVLLFGILVYIGASFVCAFANNIETLIISRVFQAIGGCCGIVVTRAIIRDVYSREAGAGILGYVIMVVSLAPMVAPIIGGFLDQYYSWRASFYFVGGFGTIIAFIAYKNLYETNFNKTTSLNIRNLPAQFASLLKEKQFLGYALSRAFNNAVFFSFITGAPFIIADILHLPPSAYAIYFALVAGGYMFGNFLAGKFSQKLSIQTMIDISNVIMAVGIITAVTCFNIGFSHPLYLFAPMSLIAISAGINNANAMAGLLDVRPDIAGTASGLSGFMQMATAAFATFLVGHFYIFSGITTIISMTFFAISSIIVYYLLVPKDRKVLV